MRLFDAVREPVLEVGYRLGGWPRRVAALLCLALAVLTALNDHEKTAPAATAPVVVASRDLAAGSTVRGRDILVAYWAPTQIPARALRSAHAAIGSSVAAGVDRGEPLTSARIRGPGIAVGLGSGLVAVTVSVRGSGGAGFIHPGDSVDLLATIPSDVGVASAAAKVVASGARVLAVLGTVSNPADSESTGLTVAVSRATALALASVVDGSMTVTLRMPP